MKSARGVVDPQTLQIQRFEIVQKAAGTMQFSFKNSAKLIAKTHFRLDVGQNLQKFRIQVRKGPSPGGPESFKSTTKTVVRKGVREGGPRPLENQRPGDHEKPEFAEMPVAARRGQKKRVSGMKGAPKTRLSPEVLLIRGKVPFGQKGTSNRYRSVQKMTIFLEGKS